MFTQVMETCDWKAKADKHATLRVKNKPGSKISVNQGTWLVQLVEHVTFDLGVVKLSPHWV